MLWLFRSCSENSLILRAHQKFGGFTKTVNSPNSKSPSSKELINAIYVDVVKISRRLFHSVQVETDRFLTPRGRQRRIGTNFTWTDQKTKEHLQKTLGTEMLNWKQNSYNLALLSHRWKLQNCRKKLKREAGEELPPEFHWLGSPHCFSTTKADSSTQSAAASAGQLCRFTTRPHRRLAWCILPDNLHWAPPFCRKEVVRCLVE